MDHVSQHLHDTTSTVSELLVQISAVRVLTHKVEVQSHVHGPSLEDMLHMKGLQDLLSVSQEHIGLELGR